MNKMVSPADLDHDACTIITMTRTEKLMRFARIVREHDRPLWIFHGLEYRSARELEACMDSMSAFACAAADPILRDAGLKGQSAADAIGFFELSQHELHEFSCDCGGVISNAEMANRIERLASPSTPATLSGHGNVAVGGIAVPTTLFGSLRVLLY